MDIQQFLEQSLKGEGFFAVWTRRGDAKHTEFFHTSRLREGAGYAQYKAITSDVYVSTGVMEKRPLTGRGTSKNVTAVSRLTVDIDLAGEGHKAQNLPQSVEESLSLLEGLPTPSVVLHTGGGLLVQWNLDRGYDPRTEAVGDALKGVQAHVRKNAAPRGWLVDSTHDLARVVRVPGTFNRKLEEARPVRVISETGVDYSLADFDTFRITPKAKAARQKRERSELKSLSGVGEVTVEEARELLSFVPDQLEYHQWIAVLFVLYSNFELEVALELAEEWSPGYEGEVEAKFASFEGQDYGWGLGTLVWLAREGGWNGKLASNTQQGRFLLPVDLLVEQRYLDVEMPAAKGVLVKSAIGTGKTEWLVRSLPADAKVLVVGHRKSLTRQQAERLGLGYYLDGDKALAGDRLVITVHSLGRLPHDAEYDYVIIDESEQVLSAYATDDNLRGRKGASLAQLRAFVGRATKVVFLDAHLGRVSYDAADALLGRDNLYVVENSYKHGAREVVRFSHEGSLLRDLYAFVADGGRAYVATNHKTDVAALEKTLKGLRPELRVLTVSSENSQTAEVQEVLRNVNQRITDFDVVVASPSVGTGVSIDVRGHFGRVYLLGHPGVLPHNELLQQAGRVRELVPLYSWVGADATVRETSVEKLRDEVATNAADTEAHIQISREGWVYADDDLYTGIWANTNAQVNASFNRLADHFYGELEEVGCTITEGELDEAADKTAAKALATARTEAKKLRAEAVTAAQEITDAEYETLREKAERTAEEELVYTRAKIARRYGVAVTAELVAKDDAGLFGKVLALASYEDEKFAAGLDRYVAGGLTLSADWEHNLLKAQWRKKVLQAAGVSLDSGDVLKVKSYFAKWALQNKEVLRRVLGITVQRNVAEEPLRVVGAVLGQLGISLSTKSKRHEGVVRTEYRVNLRTVEEMRRFATFQLERSAAREAEKAERAERARELGARFFGRLKTFA